MGCAKIAKIKCQYKIPVIQYNIFSTRAIFGNISRRNANHYTTLLQIVYELMCHSKMIMESIIDPDNCPGELQA